MTGHALNPQRRCFDLLIASDVCYDEARLPFTRHITKHFQLEPAWIPACTYMQRYYLLTRQTVAP